MSGSKKLAYTRKTQEQRRLDLIEAGIQCLGKGGMSGFTVDRICRQAGVSRGLINHHFNSKNDLLVSIYAHMTDHMRVVNLEQSPRDVITSVIDFSLDGRTFDRLSLRAWLALWGEIATNAELRELHEKRYDRFINHLARAIRTFAMGRNQVVDGKQLARQLMALVDGLWLEHCLHSTGMSLSKARRDCYRFLELNFGKL